MPLDISKSGRFLTPSCCTTSSETSLFTAFNKIGDDFKTELVELVAVDRAEATSRDPSRLSGNSPLLHASITE